MGNNKWTSRLACGALVMTTVIGVAVAAGSQGTKADPLVTLSYLNDTAVPAIMKQVEEKLDEREANLTKQMQEGGQAVFVSVEVAAGKMVTLSGGSQMLLRSGTASSDAALIDLTDGSTWSGTGNLVENHLYMAVGDGQKVSATTEVTMMVQGSYTMD